MGVPGYFHNRELAVRWVVNTVYLALQYAVGSYGGTLTESGRSARLSIERA